MQSAVDKSRLEILMVEDNPVDVRLVEIHAGRH